MLGSNPKTIVDVCRVLAGWENKYITKDNKMTDANYGVAFAKTEEKLKEQKEGNHMLWMKEDSALFKKMWWGGDCQNIQ